jgi:hypothetical protein
MQVQALVFGEVGTAKFLDLTPYYENLPTDPYSAPLGHQLRRETDNPPEPGVHLHWTLPAAFTHVRPAATDDRTPPEPELPSVPNRWVVIRLWEEGGKLHHRSWIVDSDLRGDDQGSPWLESEGGSYQVTRLGGWTPLETWSRPQPAQTPLKAFAPGNLAFAAFYPSCRGVFGFHDQADLVEGTVYSYLVAGWFADRANDPLNVRKPRPDEEQEEARLKKSLTEKECWLRRMGQLQWAVPGDAKVLPTAVTCYGVMSHIEWDPSRECNSFTRPAVKVTLGNSVTEAAAALANPTIDSQRLLSELQYATLAERRPTYNEAHRDLFFERLSRLPGARAKIHERAFSPQDGGLSWEVALQQNGTASEDANAQPLARLTKDVADKLRQLNRAQREYDDITRTLAGWQQRLFAVWYQRQYLNSTAAAQPATDAQNLLDQEVATCEDNVDVRISLTSRERLVGRGVEMASRLTDRQTQEAACTAAMTALKEALRKDMPKASLVARAMPQFWRANDPFVLITGLEVPAMQGGASPLQCRVSDNAIAGISLPVQNISGPIRIERAELRAEQNWDKPWAGVRDDIPKDIEELLLDVLFTDRDRAEFLARVYLRHLHDDPPPDQLARGKNAIAETLRDIKAAVARASDPLQITGVHATALDSLVSAINLPSPTSWRPVFMRWKLDWYPYCQEQDLPISDPAVSPPPRSTVHWNFTWEEAGRVDYQWKRPQPSDDRKARAFDGFTVIAANIERGLKLTSDNFPEYKSVFEQMTKALLGQSLAGLTDALGMRDTGPQLPPLKGPGELSVDKDMVCRVGHHYTVAPLSRLNLPGEGSPFSPLRGGLFSLSHLSIIDSFGRILIIHDAAEGVSNPPKLGRALRTPTPDGGLALLPPRLVQPSRVLLRWLSAWDDDQESLGDLETNPICGFIIHNRFDGSLLIYGTSNDEKVIYPTGNDPQPPVGRLLGAVQAVQSGGRPGAVRWSTIPMRPFTGTPESLGPRVLTAADIPNPHLCKFVNGLLKLTGGALGTPFQTFVDLLRRRDEASDLPADQGLQSLLTGRPLALVRASLRLELDGPPLRDETAIPSGEAPAYLSVKFPVRLGDRRLGPDGLVGYFVDDGTDTAYHHLRLGADEDSYQKDEAHRYFHDQRDLEVQCDPSVAPIKLTLLLDPQPGVHIVSGILPANRVRLPQPLVAATLSDLEMPFLVAPFLGERVTDPGAPRRMPLPTTGDKEWTWKFFDDAREEPQEVDVRVDPEAAPSLFVTMGLHEGWLNYHPSRAKPARAKPNGESR